MQRVEWTDELVNKIKDLRVNKMSYGMIGKKLNISKSAVLGKMHRIKIKQGHKVNSVRYKKNDNMGSPLGATHKMQTYFPKHGEGNCNICKKKFTKYSKFDLFCSAKCRNYYGYC